MLLINWFVLAACCLLYHLTMHDECIPNISTKCNESCVRVAEYGLVPTRMPMLLYNAKGRDRF